MTHSPPLVIICAVGLTPSHVTSGLAPYLSALAAEGFAAPMTGAVPAVTTTAQATMLTGCWPDQHGIVANGWFFRDLNEVLLWRQSQALVEAAPAWAGLTVDGRPLRVLKHFWWYAMNTGTAATVTPRPVYHADGRKSPDCYAWPPDLKALLDARHGTFPLFHFWGPSAGARSSRWIAESFVSAWDHVSPDLALCYLPHLDYDLQRLGPDGPHLANNLAVLDACCATVIDHVRAQGATVLVVSEYGLEPVHAAVDINRHLRQAGLLEVIVNRAGELIDFGTSPAFAVADHQIAHVYCRDAAATERAAALLSELPGIERVLAGAARSELHLNHPRSGELVALAAPGHWFSYDYWLDDARRPDFATTIDIHRKPGYDPRELLFDPHGGRRRALWALIRKGLGLRYCMNPVSLDPTLVKGSHGRPASDPNRGPVIISSQADWRTDRQRESWDQRAIAALIRAHWSARS